MTGTAKYTYKNISDDIQIFQGKIAFVQLPIPQPLIDYPANSIFNTAHIGLGNRTDCRLTAICQHDESCFFGLGFWPFISVILFNDALTMFTFCCLFIKIRNQGCAMMLAHNIRNYFRQFIFPAEIQPIPDMGSHNHRG